MNNNRVLVTRASEQVGDLVERLTAIGCEVIEFPLIEIVEPIDHGSALRKAMVAADATSEESTSYAWIVLTSPNAADRSLRHLHKAAGAQIAAIGPGTANVCLSLGFSVSLIPDRSIGEGLVEAFPDCDVPGARVLLPRAETARDVVPEGLAAKGWIVDTVTAYRTQPRKPTASECERAATATMALATSSSTARLLVAVLGGRVPPIVVSIGPQTTATFEELGVHVDATAEPHTIDGLVQQVARLMV